MIASDPQPPTEKRYIALRSKHFEMWPLAGDWCGGTRSLDACMGGQTTPDWPSKSWAKHSK